MKFTEEQQQVIDLRNRNLLVSAAAGSGKTAVLVQRIISKITDLENPVDIDQMLIVTFTNAAAAEMRERIGDAIEERLSQYPADINLQRQQTLLHNAQITTIHSFCLFVIRNYFHRIQLEPDFRIADEGELKLLRGDVLDDVLEQYYQKEEPDFVTLAETLATGKNDEKLKEAILTLYEFAMSAPWPKEWLEECVAPYEVRSSEAFEKQPMAQALHSYLKAITTQWTELMKLCIEISEEADGPEMYADFLAQELEMLEKVLDCETFNEYDSAIQSLKFGRLPAARKFQGDMGKKQYVQALRNEIKDSVKKLIEQFFFLPPEEMIGNLGKNKTLIKMLIQVTIDFIEAYSAKKREKNILDFNDLEHFALEILIDGETKEPSHTAQDLQKQYEEIMIDEYQDSNYVQETILGAVSRGQNLFMVGDVKQSIYRFRMARPELFMEKYDTYTSTDSVNQKIDLHKNFRSRGQVLNTVNDIFYGIMAKDLGNVEYDAQAALYQGMEFPESTQGEMFDTEILIADPAHFTEAEELENLEAVMIAGKIKKLLKTQQVKDKESGELRPLTYGDIVILMRGISSYGQQMTEVLKENGIPALTTTGTGYFSAIEVQTILNLLRLVDNPRQDIPMAAVLQSVIGGITTEEMAKIRITFRDCPFYQGVFSYAEKGEEVLLREKIKKFLTLVEKFRERVYDTPIHELLYQIMDETGYMDYVYAQPSGKVRRANLEMLLEKAIAYEQTSYRGVFHFIRYIDRLKKYEVDFGEAEVENGEDAVRIMTIHKSKGLEFPVVFLAGMGRQLNQQDIRNRMVLHPKYGIGLDVTDLEKRVRIPSLARQTLARQIQMENAGEELRVLYVALTRAREKLILTGTLKKAEEKLDAFVYERMEQNRMGFLKRLKASCYFDWVLPIMVQKNYPIKLVTPLELTESQAEEKVEKEWNRELLLELAEQSPEELLQEIETRFSYKYPYEKERDLKMKLSVSELKQRAIERLRQEENDTEYMFEKEEVQPYVPEFMQEAAEENQGALRGTAIHRALEFFDFSKDFHALQEQIEAMREKGLLEERLYERISMKKLQMFLESELAQRMQQAALKGKLYREKPFVIGKRAAEINMEDSKNAVINHCANRLFEKDENPVVLIQGIIDAFFEENGELVLVDYKTDAVRTEKELTERYQMQMNLYQEALEKATGKKVKEKLLYSFKLQKVITV